MAGNLTCIQLHKRAERFAYLCIEQAKLKSGDHVALLYPPGETDKDAFSSEISGIITRCLEL